MSPSPEDVIRVRDLRRKNADEDRRPGSNQRLTEITERLTRIGAVNVKVDGTNKKRTIPTPWLDCADCGRRHYPSTIAGRWHIATTCLSCGKALPGPE